MTSFNPFSRPHLVEYDFAVVVVIVNVETILSFCLKHPKLVFSYVIARGCKIMRIVLKLVSKHVIKISEFFIFEVLSPLFILKNLIV